MPFCSFEKNAGMYDVTPIENMFLLEYLPLAPDEFVRVYLYARMLCLHPELGDGMDEVARALHMDSEAIYNAMTYWERQGLVRRLTDRPPTYEILPLLRGSGGASDPMEEDYYEYRDFNANLQALFGSELLQPKQYAMANDWINILGFTQDAVLKMVEEKLRRSRSKKPRGFFEKLNETAARWAERGIRTSEDVMRALEIDGQVEKTAAAVMKQFSMHRAATVDELHLVSRWLNEWNYTQADIIAACAETTKARKPTMSYLNSVLENRRKGGSDLFEGLKMVLKELGAGETPTPDQLRAYGDMLEKGFEPQTVRLAAAQCARKKKHRFEELEWMVGKWADRRLFKFEDADGYVRDMNQLTAEVRVLLEQCGTDRRPQLDDIAMYEHWRGTYPKALIDYAAQCARGMQLPMRYIDKLLTEWEKSGVTTADEAKVQHEDHSVRTASAPTAAPANPALNYEQRPQQDNDFYDLFIDLGDEDGNGGNAQ